MKTNINQNNEEVFFTVCNDEGEKVQCKLLLILKVTGKDYIAYTDNTKDDEGNIRVYANQFNPDGSETSLLPIEDEQIWSLLEKTLAEIQECTM